jgi:UrcA family protein
MNVSTSKISNLIYDSEARSPALHPEVRSAALVWIISLLGTALLTFIVCLLGITPAWSGTPDVRSVTVSYGDLDLSSPAGANALYRRIQGAAKQVCGYAGADLIEQSIWRGCYRNAIANAVGKVNNPLLTAVHTGSPAAVTAMLVK